MTLSGTILAVCCIAATVFTPSPGTPGEGRGEGSCKTREIADSRPSQETLTLALSRNTGRGDEAPATIAAAPHFQTVDIYIDTADKPLAAYQFSLRSLSGNALLSGIAGADHPAFSKPPYYDTKALIDEKVVIAALSTDESLPSGRTRVARLTVQVSGGADPRYELTLQAAAGPDGNPVPAKVTVEAKER